ncbi:MAG TPA: amidohydrolase family protein [Pseudonocardia sp.]|jgi:4-oxalmesaconate hydratase
MIIDIHGHYTPPAQATAYQASLVTSRGRPREQARPPRLPDELIAAQMRPHLDKLAAVGTDRQLISPRPYAMMHSVKPARVVRLWTTFVNDVIARQVALSGGVFLGMAGLPQYRDGDIGPAVEELDRCVTELGFVGCLLNPDPLEADDGPRPPGLGDEYWYPLYEKLTALDVPALVHSASSVDPREPYTLHFINEESIAVLDLIESSVFTEFPTLKIVVSHTGGAIPYHAGRFRAWRFRTPGAESFDQSLHRLYFDTCNYSKAALEHFFGVVRPENVLFGTENPGTGSAIDPATGRALDDLRPVIESIDRLTDKDRQLIFAENARRLYRLG